jgi:diguanylate cyclase (GGDEF)-like protein/PAS domain S-box-containing protein
LLVVDVGARGSIEALLQLAQDLCLGVGAFLVTPTGEVDAVVSEAMPPEDGPRRIGQLARNCLTHPAAGGRELFWNAEESTEADSADLALACVVFPVRTAGGEPMGLLGVVDTWLPEPDDDERAALKSMATELADGLSSGSLRRPGTETVDDIWSVDDGPAGDRAANDRPAGDRAANDRPAGDRPGRDWPAGDLPSLVLDHLPDGVVVTRRDGGIVFVNAALCRMVGRSATDLVGTDVRSLVAGAEHGGAGVAGSPTARPSAARRLLLAGPDGELLPVVATDVPIAAGGSNGADRFLTVVRPAPSQSGCESAAEIDVVDLAAGLDDGVLCLDATGTVVLANHGANRLHGLPDGRSLLGRPLPDVTALRTEEGQLVTSETHPGVLALRSGAPATARLLLGGDGDQVHVTATARPFPVDGRAGALVVMHDETAEWRERQRLTQYALFDPLTGLANRYLLLEELRRMLLWLGRRGGTVALVYLDLDGFKRINDEYGHETGDDVLAAVARRLRGAVRSDDVVARLGGDEFVIAHASTDPLPDGDVVVSRLRKVLSAPFRVRNRAFDVGASIGWVSTDSGEEGPDPLLAKADRAMYLQKRNRAMTRRGAA